MAVIKSWTILQSQHVPGTASRPVFGAAAMFYINFTISTLAELNTEYGNYNLYVIVYLLPY